MFPLLGAVLGGIGGAQKRQGDLARQRQTGQAAADAQAVSWAKRGQQFIPEVEYAKGSMLGNVLGGAIGGGLQGTKLGEIDWLKSFGQPEIPEAKIGVGYNQYGAAPSAKGINAFMPYMTE